MLQGRKNWGKSLLRYAFFRTVRKRIRNYHPELLPQHSGLLILPYGAHTVARAIANFTKPVHEPIDRVRDVRYFFMGRVYNDSFSLVRRPEIGGFFAPIIKGQIDNISTGCIVFLKYKMLWGTKLLIGFWSIFGLLSMLLLFFWLHMYWYGLLSLSVVFLNYLVAIYNFNRQVKLSKDLLRSVFQTIEQYQ